MTRPGTPASPHRPLVHRRPAAPRAVVLAFTNPTVNSYRRLVPGSRPRSTSCTRQRNRSACTRIPVTGSNRRPSGSSSACRTRRATRNLSFSAQMMAGLDGIKNKIEPPSPIDKDLYDLPPEEWAPSSRCRARSTGV